MARRVFLVAIVALVDCACMDRAPTGTSPIESPPGAGTSVALSGAAQRQETTFDCSELEEVRVRFSDPGFLDRLEVGLYVSYLGLPAGERRLRIWWDFENAYDETQDFVLDDAVIDRIDGREVYGRVHEHRYLPVAGPTPVKVRAALSVAGRQGECVRSRDIVVLPATPVVEDTSGKPCNGQECKVFLTSTRHDGNLGGVAGGDAICQARADAAGLPGVFRAWLSDNLTSPSSRFSRSSTPYVLVDGTVIAASWSALTSGSLVHHIDRTELGSTVTGIKTVWTRTLSNGASASFGLGPDCQGWTVGSSGDFGTNGQFEGQLALWSFLGASSCNAQLRLYCFQQ